MAKVSILIPSRNEHFLPQTVADLLSRAAGDIEIIVNLDGYWPDPMPVDDPRVIYIHRTTAMGMRAGINAAASIARGEYLMKIDGHCTIGEGYDQILQENCDADWLVIPRRYSLDEDNWQRREDKAPVDYEYLRYPLFKPDEIGIHGTIWPERARTRKDIPIDDNMGFQGSCWFMPKAYFWKFGGMDETGYGTFIGEPQEIGCKVWLSGGRVVTNKLAWYAHLHKGKRWGRGYYMSKQETGAGNLFSVDFWYNDRPFTGRTRTMEWLIDHFWPVPTWPGKERVTWEPWTL